MDADFLGLQVVGATTLLGTSPNVVLGFKEWVQLTVSGSHLDIQSLYCRIHNQLYQLQIITSIEGKCTVSVKDIEEPVEIHLITTLGEIVPGVGRLTVVQGEAMELWPRLQSVTSSERGLLEVTGSGFRPGESKCILNENVCSALTSRELIKIDQECDDAGALSSG